jgi:hypothetical protein
MVVAAYIIAATVLAVAIGAVVVAIRERKPRPYDPFWDSGPR